MNDLEVIENYLNGQLPADERTRFETALRTDPALADALAFYVLTKHTAKIDAREQRRAELDALRQTRHPQTEAVSNAETNGRTRPLWSAPMRWAAAASVVLLLGLGWFFLRDASGSADPVQMADAYISDKYGQLSTTMGGPADRLSEGVELYNRQQFAEAETIFGQLLAQQPDNERVLRYAGLVALRQEKYDVAIERFQRLGQRTDLFSNPGIFLEALARLKRNQPMDKDLAKKLLEDVVNRNLEGRTDAQAILKKL